MTEVEFSSDITATLIDSMGSESSVTVLSDHYIVYHRDPSPPHQIWLSCACKSFKVLYEGVAETRVRTQAHLDAVQLKEREI